MKARTALLAAAAACACAASAAAAPLRVVPSLVEASAAAWEPAPDASAAVPGAADDAGGKLIKLANTGIDGTAPVQGKVQGPFASVRSTTIPWNMRPMLGQQVNGAPEPLVYAPVYRFTPTQAPRKRDPMDMFKTPYAYMKGFATPGAKYTVQGDASPGRGLALAPALFSSHAPQPPPYVAPVPPDPGEHPLLREPADGPPSDNVDI